ncbi:MAG: substrate-binding domain-containing protein [Muribaculaceae bacterium]|nr:substrate-binding domain-containing protein [Muribaculaceae bacterium]
MTKLNTKAISEMKKILGIVVLAIALMTGATSCKKFSEQRKGNTSTSGLTTVMCDNSFKNIMQQEIDVYEYCYPEASVIPYYVSEREALDSVLSLKSPLAVISRELTPEETKYLKDRKKTARCQRIAVDAIALIVNPENPIEQLSKKEIGEILTGKVENWNDIWPSKLGKIDVVFDDAQSSTVKYMRDSLTHGEEFGSNVYAQGSNQAVFEAVKTHKNAIGVIGVSWIASDLKTAAASVEERARTSQSSDTTNISFNESIKVLKVNGNDSPVGYKPYQAYIFSGEYPLYRSIFMVCTSVPGTTAHGFFSFVTGVQGQKLIQMTGILPATVRPRMVSVN